MDNLERRFTEESNKRPKMSSFVIFMSLITGKKYKEEFLLSAFNSIVDREDWRGIPEKEIIEYVVAKNAKI